MEFPLVPYLAAILYRLFGFNVYTVRGITVFAFLLLSLYMYRLCRREIGPIVGLLAALSSTIMPLGTWYSNMLFSDPVMLACEVMALFYFAEWVDFRRRRDLVVSLSAFSLAVALKLTPLYLLLPFGWLLYRKNAPERQQCKTVLYGIAVALIAPALWYSYAYYLKVTSIDVFGIIGGHNKFQPFTMLSDPAWYRTMTYRLGREVLGGEIGSILALLGFLSLWALRRRTVFYSYLAAVLVFFVLVAEGQIDAPYRQLDAIPVFSAFLALGTVLTVAGLMATTQLVMRFRLSLKATTALLLAAASVLILTTAVQKNSQLSLKKDPSLPGDPPSWTWAGTIMEYAHSDSKLVTMGEYSMHVGGNDLSPLIYHYTGLQGWSLQKNGWSLQRIETLRRKGAALLAARHINRESGFGEFLAEVAQRYTVLYRDRDKVLIDLAQPRRPPNAVSPSPPLHSLPVSLPDA
jgi:4-amino-4-deoxy-L-arabinose transferase-like glycosyltransferase